MWGECGDSVGRVRRECGCIVFIVWRYCEDTFYRVLKDCGESVDILIVERVLKGCGYSVGRVLI